MNDNNFGFIIAGLAAAVLGLATLGQRKEGFGADPEVVSQDELNKQVEQAREIEKVNVTTSYTDVVNMDTRYYKVLENYLSPTNQNLELAGGINMRSNVGTVKLPGAAQGFSNEVGDGYVSYTGILNNVEYSPVSYVNERADKLSGCAKDLPMFAASSLLPKPSTNAENNVLSQNAASALSTFSALSPMEQIGSLTSVNLPYGKVTSYRGPPETNYGREPIAFYASSSDGINPTFGSFNSQKLTPGVNSI